MCVVASLIIANSPLGTSLENLLTSPLGIHTDQVHLRYSILSWINDGLMAIFFLMVGLEIKRELAEGQLSSIKKATLPLMAAIGGVAVPASIYLLFNHGLDTADGWAIPMATDIAFAIAIITMLGKRVPLSLKIFLAALAIVDDLFAILVIAIFYTSELQFSYLLYAGIIFAILLIFNKLKIQKLYFYLIPGLFIWYFIHHSGIHATIAGVLVAFAIPVKKSSPQSQSPLEILEHILVRPVNFLIMPLFAFANTNIRIQEEMLSGLFTPLGLGIILGLVVGKPVGITFITWIAVKFKIADLPDQASWKHLVGTGMLAGIGFTMSIFIAMLSLAGYDLLIAEAKFSILIASVISGISGYTLLNALGKKKEQLKASS